MKRSVKRQLLHSTDDVFSCEEITPAQTKNTTADNSQVPSVNKRILSPRNGDIRVDSCQPMKKRILAYSKQLEIEEQENIESGLPAVPSDLKNKVLTRGSTSSDCSSSTKEEPYSFVKDLESVSNINNFDFADAVNNKCSVIVRRDSITLNEEQHVDRNENNDIPTVTTSPIKKANGVAEQQNRWNSALALIQLASSPPTKKK